MSWNVQWRTGAAADAVGAYLGVVDPEVAFLQDVHPKAIERITEAAGFAWQVSTAPASHDAARGRRSLVSIAGRTGAARVLPGPDGLPLPERVLAVAVYTIVGPTTLVSYYAPPGVRWGIAKPRQAVATALWLSGVAGPIIMGADADTPQQDPIDETLVRTHWPTGSRKLAGEPGDDLLWGPAGVHRLRDAWRVWLNADPSRLDHIADDGPLAESLYTGRHRTTAGTPRRYDSIWATPELDVSDARYDSSVLNVFSDHAPVIIDFRPRP